MPLENVNMKFLILSCKTGGGHDAAANALKLQFEKMGHEAFVFDYLTLAGEKVAKRVANAYVNTVKTVPYVFGEVYKLGMYVSKHSKESPVYKINKKMAKYLIPYLEEHHYDAIIMTHLFPAETLTYMKKENVKLPLFVGVATDYTCTPFWEETDCDFYIIPHELLMSDFTKRGMPIDKLYPLGIPFTPKILNPISKEEAREKLQLKLNKKIALLLGGSMGAGKLIQLVKNFNKIKDKNYLQIVVICGNNKRIYHKLLKLYGKNEMFVILGHTNQMDLYLKACDIVYTKPGGLTSTEAAASRLPLVHTFPIPGCETANKNFFHHLGMSISAPNAKELTERGLKLLNSENDMEKMKKAQEKNVSLDATEKIAQLIIDKVQKQNQI